MTHPGKGDLMDRDRAVPLARYVRTDDGGTEPEFIDPSDPASILDAKEAAELEQQRAAAAHDGREDVLDLLMAYLFADDPHPAHVLRRLWLGLGELAPHLRAGVMMHEAALLADPGEIGHAWRVRLLVAGTRHARRLPSKHDVIVRHTLAAAHAKRPMLELAKQVPLDTLTRLRPGESVPQFGARQEATLKLLEFFYVATQASIAQGLPRPEAVLRVVYLVAKSLTPHLILHMSLQQLGDMFAQERATWSYRGKHKLAAFLAARGAQGYRAPHQKTEATCAKYAAAQRGNRNRVSMPKRMAG